MKKLLGIILALVMVLSLFAGCGNSNETTTEETEAATEAVEETEASAEPVNIVWAGWSGEEEASKDIFQRMMDTYKTNTGNDVTWVGWTWADTAQQLLIRTQGGEQLDIAQVDIGIFNTIAAAGVLADWNEILGADYMSETFEQSALDVGNIDGQQLAMPWSMASITMVYNPEILAAAGWDTVPTTIAEFEQCMADIKAYDPEIIPYAVSTKDATCAGDFMPWLWTFGGAIFNEDGSVAINSEAAVECVKWYQSLMEKGYIAMDTGRGEARQSFAQGKVAFYDDAVVAKGQAVNNGVAPEDVVKVCSAMERPVLNAGDEPQSTMWGHMLVVFKDSEYKEQAAELAKTRAASAASAAETALAAAETAAKAAEESNVEAAEKAKAAAASAGEAAASASAAAGSAKTAAEAAASAQAAQKAAEDAEDAAKEAAASAAVDKTAADTAAKAAELAKEQAETAKAAALKAQTAAEEAAEAAEESNPASA